MWSIRQPVTYARTHTHTHTYTHTQKHDEMTTFKRGARDLVSETAKRAAHQAGMGIGKQEPPHGKPRKLTEETPSHLAARPCQKGCGSHPCHCEGRCTYTVMHMRVMLRGLDTPTCMTHRPRGKGKWVPHVPESVHPLVRRQVVHHTVCGVPHQSACHPHIPAPTKVQTHAHSPA